MAFLTPGRGTARPGYRRGRFYLRFWRGKLIAQSWPRPRGQPTTTRARAQQDYFRLLQKTVDLWNADERCTMDEWLSLFLRQHRGVKGTAAIRLRDWLTRIASGNMWAADSPDTPTIRTQRQIRIPSDALDILEPRPGSLLTRTGSGWHPTVQCAPGAVLVQAHGSPDPGCCPPASPADPSTAAGGHDK